MAIFTHLLGSLLVMLWFGIYFMNDSIVKIIPSPYAEDLIRYQWLILGIGVFLSIMGFVNKIKQLRNMNTRGHRSPSGARWQKKNFELEQRKENFVSRYDSTINKLSGQIPEQHELAKKVEWSPLAGGGANFKTSYLHQSKQSRIEVLKSNGAKLFSVVFILMGGVIPGFIVFELVVDEGFGWEVLGIVAFGGIFLAVGIAMLFYPKPRVFDKNVGWFWAGSKGLTKEQTLSKLKNSARLNDIAAIQLVPEYLSGKNSSYTSWEINLVSHDAQRLNVMDHGNKKSIDADAQILSEFLDVPVWENTQI